MKDTTSVAVIGAGYWGKKVSSEYLTLEREQERCLLYVCDNLEDNLRYCNENFNIPRSRLLDNHREVLDSDIIDAVHICTPNNTHYQLAKEALTAGKHVLLEKPMTLSSGQAFDLMNLAKKEELILQVGYIFRFNNALTEARKLIEERYFGDLYYLRLQWTTLTLPTPKRDIIFDLGPHPVDVVNFLLETWPSKVTCKARSFTRKNFPETAYALLELDKSVMANIELSWLQPGKERRADIIGSERSATIDCLNQEITIFQSHGSVNYNIDVQPNNTILTEVNNFIENISGKTKSVNSGLVGPLNVLVLENLQKSIVEDRTLKIDFTARVS